MSTPRPSLVPGAEVDSLLSPARLDGALTAVREVASDIEVADASDAELLSRLCRTIVEVLRCRAAVFWRLDPAGTSLQLQPGAIGLDGAETESELPVAPGDGTLLSRIVFEDYVYFGQLDPEDPALVEYRERLSRSNVRSAVVTAWRSGGVILGMVAALDADHPGGFEDAAVWMLRMLSSVSGLAWSLRAERLRSLAAKEREASQLRGELLRAGRLERTKSDFLKLASHELRGPLGIVRGYVSLAEEGHLGPLQEELRSAMGVIHSKLDEMQVQVDQLTEAARLEDHRLVLNIEPVDIGALIRDAVATVVSVTSDSHEISIALPATPPVVSADRRRVTTILINLIHNAAKYSPAGTHIRVAAHVDPEGASVVVDVRDEGGGLSEEQLGRLFQRFGRLVTPDTAHIPGTGLGLYLSRELALMHGGDISVDSTPGAGSCFSLLLPLYEVSPGTAREINIGLFNQRDMMATAALLRRDLATADSLASAGAEVASTLHDLFRDRAGQRDCVLVRVFVSRNLEQLTPEQRALVDSRQTFSPGTRFLTLAGTTGELPAWQNPLKSRAHAAIPLMSAAQLAGAPMIWRLVEQLELDVAQLLQPDPSLMLDAAARSTNVFHVEDALGSPYLPDQDTFVKPHRIRSVVGFGGSLPQGDVYAVILFSKAHIPVAAAQRFRGLSHTVRAALGRWVT